MPERPTEQSTYPLVLAIDVGTSSVRALLFDRRGTALDFPAAQKAYDLATTPDGGATVDAEMLFDLTVMVIDQALSAAGADAKHIAAVGISCFWHSLLGLDGNAHPVTPVFLWADKRSAREVEELRASFDQRDIHQRTGCVIHSSYWPAKLRWLRAEAPEQFEAASRWCAFSDYLLRRVSGADLTSISMASGTGMLDVRNGVWDLGVADMTGIDPETLPRIADAGETVKSLLPEYAERWPALASVPWLPSLGDGACANVGAGGVGDDRIALSLGTSGAMRIVIGRRLGAPVIIPEGLWAYRLDHGRIVLGAAISNGGKVLAWMNDLLESKFDGEEMTRAAELQPDSHGLTILPFLAGERSPIWNDRATAVIAGLKLSTGRAELLRAGMESVGLRFARLYHLLKPVAAKRHEIVAGGAAILNSPAWLQITADCLHHPLTAPPPTEESSARGAAIMALLAADVISKLRDASDPAEGATVIRPSAEAANVYAHALKRQSALESLLFPNGSSWDHLFVTDD
jgi:gluconokinase